jgi:hypothetical protein
MKIKIKALYAYGDQTEMYPSDNSASSTTLNKTIKVYLSSTPAVAFCIR